MYYLLGAGSVECPHIVGHDYLYGIYAALVFHKPFHKKMSFQQLLGPTAMAKTKAGHWVERKRVQSIWTPESYTYI